MPDLYHIDLHLHTNVSDGTDTPEELLRCVREAGIRLFSITDHDGYNAHEALRGRMAEDDPRLLTGIEFSCKDEEGKYHILGYNFDPDADAIVNVVEIGHAYRMRKVRKRLDLLKEEYNIDLPEEEVKHLLAMENPGKPHIGNLLVKYGYSETRDQAINEIINKLHVHSEYVRPEEAIAGILGAGGIPVLAQPLFGSGDELILGDEMDARLRRLMGFGLQGVEGFYSGFTDKLRAQVLALAEKYGLYVTAGSDYHGKNKLVRLGDTGLDEVTEFPEGLTRFLKAVGVRS